MEALMRYLIRWAKEEGMTIEIEEPENADDLVEYVEINYKKGTILIKDAPKDDA